MQTKQEHDECQGLTKFNSQCSIQSRSIELKAFKPQAAEKNTFCRANAFMCCVYGQGLDQKYGPSLSLSF